MLKNIVKVVLPASIIISVMSGCAMFGDGIPEEKLGEYALVVSRIGMRGSDMDTLPSSQIGFENTASISWINGKLVSPREKMNVLPGEYDFQVGLGCDNTASCRPSRVYNLTVKAGYRYVLTPNGFSVSDRRLPRSPENEKSFDLYR